MVKAEESLFEIFELPIDEATPILSSTVVFHLSRTVYDMTQVCNVVKKELYVVNKAVFHFRNCTLSTSYIFLK